MFDFSLDNVRTPVLELKAGIRKRVLAPEKGSNTLPLHPAVTGEITRRLP